MKKSLSFICILLIILSNPLWGQVDTTFWFVAPEVSKHAPTVLDSPVVFRIATFNTPANITVSMPAGGGMPSQTFSVPANSTYTVELGYWLSMIENKPPNTILNKGIHVQSDAQISVYYEVVTGAGILAPRQDNPEIFTLKGNNALGTYFTIPGQTLLRNGTSFSPLPYTAFDIVATENNTNVTITPSHNLVGRSANIPFTINLNRGQTYSATANQQTAGQHLNGSIVSSDKPVAITLSDDLILGSAPYSGGCGDLGGEQLVPDALLGTEYIAINGNLNGPNSQVFITATQNNTQIFIDGVYTTTIAQGQNYMHTMGTAGSCYITSTLPINVWQLSGIGCEFGLTQLPTLTCTGSKNVSYIRATHQQLYYCVVIKDGYQGNFTVNGNPSVITTSNFNYVPGTGNQWVYAKVLLPLSTYPKGSVIKLENPSSNFHLGVLDGGQGSGTSYGYFSNYGSNLTEITMNQTDFCTGDNIQFGLNYNVGDSISWTGPNSFTSTAPNPTLLNANLNHSGWYYVSTFGSECSGTDSVYIIIGNRPTLLTYTLSDSIACEGDSIILIVNHNGSSLTFTPNSSLSGSGSQFYLHPTSNTKYIIKSEGSNGCSIEDSFNIYINSAPLIDYSLSDSGICLGDTITLSVSYSSYDSLSINPDDDIYGTSPNFILTPQSNRSYLLKVEDSIGCVTTQNINIYVDSPDIDLNISVEDSTQLCDYKIVKLHADNTDFYEWEPADYLNDATLQNPIAQLGRSTYFSVKGTSLYGCISIDSILVPFEAISKEEFIPNAYTPNKDGLNDIFYPMINCVFEIKTFRVFNRFGNLVYETSIANEGWDGTYRNQGKPCDVGVYYWYVEGVDEKGNKVMRKGDVSLIR